MTIWNPTDRTPDFEMGEVVNAARLNANVRDFQMAFTDTFTTYTMPLYPFESVGYGTGATSVGAYTRIGNMVFGYGTVTLGTGVPAHSPSTYQAATPDNCPIQSPQVGDAPRILGFWSAYNGTYYNGLIRPWGDYRMVFIRDGLSLFGTGSTGGPLSDGDSLRVWFRYEAAN